ncbi:hypothetical protein OGAPHI_000938 [Ogataea philodendri]|uniref:Uncharacterized protein n=1 Tax=Ogataea philodendri TaxID=1378263 RepID=A0A9P8PDT7_9ASCO|nr:uncharacterized protein OGAPHI_000938 [Ogataea philodendri]KAH3670423.1 hypothetical protein OGAPHI_000938 [Ogataea philodendri]
MSTGTQLDGWRAVQCTLDRTVEGKLQRGQGTDHDQSGWQTSEGTSNTKLSSKLSKETQGGLTWSLLSLVDLGKQSVGWLGNDGGSATGNDTGTKVDTGNSSGGKLFLWSWDETVDGSRSSLVSQELSNVVRNLLEQDWGETVVERAWALLSQNSGESTNQTVGKCWLGNQSDSGSLQWTQSNVSKELGNSSRTNVDGVLVLDGGLVSDSVNKSFLEQFVTTEFEGTLHGVTQNSWAQTGQQSTSTLVGNDLLQRTNHTGVVHGRLKLNSGLNNIDWGHRSVGNTATNGTSKGELGVVSHRIVRGLIDRSHLEYYAFYE